MSGGSMNYLYSTVEMNLDFELNTPERVAFYKHMQKIIKALHDIEWVDSGDYGEGDDLEAIMDCIDKKDVLYSVVEDAKETIEALSNLIKETENP